MKISLGPVLFSWEKDELIRFYDEVLDMPVDRVYLGEVVCAKRKCLTVKEIYEIGNKLKKAGKEVVISSLAVVTNEYELKMLRDIISLPFPIEANDMSVFNIIGGQDKEVISGPHITTYNVPSVQFLQGIGVKQVVFPVELSKESIEYTVKNTGIHAEVFAHGNIPLAFSWRCYTSRIYGLNKTNCQYHCKQFSDGIPLKTIDREPTFTINGASVLSALTYTLIELIEDLKAIGVKTIRISPQIKHTKYIVDVFRKRLDGTIGHDDAIELLKITSPQGFCNGWYFGKAGKEYIKSSRNYEDTNTKI